GHSSRPTPSLKHIPPYVDPGCSTASHQPPPGSLTWRNGVVAENLGNVERIKWPEPPLPFVRRNLHRIAAPVKAPRGRITGHLSSLSARTSATQTSGRTLRVAVRFGPPL